MSVFIAVQTNCTGVQTGYLPVQSSCTGVQGDWTPVQTDYASVQSAFIAVQSDYHGVQSDCKPVQTYFHALKVVFRPLKPISVRSKRFWVVWDDYNKPSSFKFSIGSVNECESNEIIVSRGILIA